MNTFYLINEQYNNVNAIKDNCTIVYLFLKNLHKNFYLKNLN